jgi:Uma2 family endonuclease
MTATTRMMTVDELERNGAPEGRWELINGELVEMSPAGEDHGAYGVAVSSPLYGYVVSYRLGRVYGPDTGFVIRDDPPTVRVPDVAFVRADRLAADRDRSRFLRVVPDLAVEVISPSESGSEVLAKAMIWLAAGVKLLWLVDPATRTVTIFAAGQAPRGLSIDDTLDGGEVLPGFPLAVRDIFAV